MMPVSLRRKKAGQDEPTGKSDNKFLMVLDLLLKLYAVSDQLLRI